MIEQPCKLCNDPMYDASDSYGCHRSKVTGALLPCKSEPAAQPQRVESNQRERSKRVAETIQELESAPAPTETLLQGPPAIGDGDGIRDILNRHYWRDGKGCSCGFWAGSVSSIMWIS